MKTFSEFINEVQATGNNNRNDYDLTDTYNNLKTPPKVSKADGEYSIRKVKDLYYLTKGEEYIGHIDGTTDKLDGKKALFIDVSYSKERGAMKILFNLVKKMGFKYTVSDMMLSDDAIKFYKKNFDSYIAVNYKDEIVQASDEELFNNADYRLAIKL